MVRVGEQHHFEWNVRSLPHLRDRKGVGWMHIVVHHSVQQQHPALESRCKFDCASSVIAFGILLGSAHGAFRIDGVVLAPVRGRCTGNCYLESLRVTKHGHQCHVSAVTMTHDRHAFGINVRALAEFLYQLRLIINISATKLHVGGIFKCLAPSGSAAIVHLGNQDAQFRLRFVTSKARRDGGNQRTTVSINH